MFEENSRELRALRIARFRDGRIDESSAIDLDAGAADKVISMLEQIKTIELEDNAFVALDDRALTHLRSSPPALSRLLEFANEEVRSILESDITARDVVAVAHRRNQLEVFGQMLEDPDFFAAATAQSGGPEKAWQAFFQANQWVLGYGLNYQYLDAWDNEKLSQITTGASVAGDGKIVDALLTTVGLIRSLCFVELKHHTTPLLHHETYRSGVWAPSKDLVGGVSQLQRTVDEAVLSIGRSLAEDTRGGETRLQAQLVQPRSVLVVGHLGEFKGRGTATDSTAQMRSFELFRRNLTHPEVLTYDELHARARFILDSSSAGFTSPTR